MAGSAMSPVAIALAVLTASGSATDLGIVLACQTVPHVGLLLVGGVVGDRFSRRSVLVLSHVGAGLTQAAVATVLLTGTYSLGVVAVLAAASGAMEAFTSPALRGIVPELVEPDQTQQANALLSSTRNATKILGPALSGVIVALAGGGWAVMVDALSFIAAAGLFATLPSAGRAVSSGGMWGDVKVGWTVFRTLTWVGTMSLCYSLLNLFNVGPWQVLGSSITSSNSGDAAWGLVLSVRAVGLLLMSLAMYRLTFRYPLRAGGILGTLGALPLLTLGATTALWPLLLAVFIGAIGFSAAGIVWETALQNHIDRGHLSRVGSIDDLLSFAAIPFGQIFVGPASAHFGAAHVAVACGIGYLVATLTPLLVPSVRNLANAPTAVDTPRHSIRAMRALSSRGRSVGTISPDIQDDFGDRRSGGRVRARCATPKSADGGGHL